MSYPVFIVINYEFSTSYTEHMLKRSSFLKQWMQHRTKDIYIVVFLNNLPTDEYFNKEYAETLNHATRQSLYKTLKTTSQC